MRIVTAGGKEIMELVLKDRHTPFIPWSSIQMKGGETVVMMNLFWELHHVALAGHFSRACVTTQQSV
jgi:hypothetical protein